MKKQAHDSIASMDSGKRFPTDLMRFFSTARTGQALTGSTHRNPERQLIKFISLAKCELND
jgi:hypothetical protein